MKYNRSFTLIELLVVIAIIGLLASIVVVNVNSAREKAKRAKALQFSQTIYHAMGSEAVEYWTFDEGAGSTVRDSAGNGNNGNWNGGGTHWSATDKILGAAAGQFNGVNDYVVSIKNVGISGTSARTLEFWAKVNAIASDQSILGWGAASTYHSFVPSIYLGHWFFWGQAYDWDTGITPQTGIWQHHAVTFDGTRVRWWIDGNQIGTGADMPLLNTTDSPFYMGRFILGWFSYANVGLDEVRVYSQALGSAQIQQHYAEGLNTHQLVNK